MKLKLEEWLRKRRVRYGLPKPCVDHLGNWYPSESARAMAYHVPPHLVRGRLGHGWTLEKALTTPVKHRR